MGITAAVPIAGGDLSTAGTPFDHLRWGQRPSAWRTDGVASHLCGFLKGVPPAKQFTGVSLDALYCLRHSRTESVVIEGNEENDARF